jgi:hypothetical protein
MFDTGRVVRQLICASIVLAVWTMARSAAAGLPPAPFCDDRGASGLAAAPLLEATDVAIQRARVTSPCGATDFVLFASLGQGSNPVAPQFDAADPAMPSCGLHLARPAGELLAEPSAALAPDYGVRFRIERPPRS